MARGRDSSRPVDPQVDCFGKIHGGGTVSSGRKKTAQGVFDTILSWPPCAWRSKRKRRRRVGSEHLHWLGWLSWPFKWRWTKEDLCSYPSLQTCAWKRTGSRLSIWGASPVRRESVGVLELQMVCGCLSNTEPNKILFFMQLKIK